MTDEFLEKIKQLANPNDEINMVGIPATDKEIECAEEILNVKFHDDYKSIIKTFGGVFVCFAIYAFNNPDLFGKETVITLTKNCRKDYMNDPRNNFVNKSYVISDDGSGNPIMIDSGGRLIIVYHDCDEYEVLANSLQEYILRCITS